MPKKLTQNEFIKECGKIHGNKYIYSKTVYVNSVTGIIITCPIHGDFRQSAGAHKSGYGCAFCSGKKLTTELFIEKSKKAHGDRYDYSDTIYINNKTPVSILCEVHGSFKQLPTNHYNGHGCPKCRSDKLSVKFRMPTKDIIKKAKHLHNNIYKYEILNQPKNNSEKIKIVCANHGPFFQKINVHLLGHGCPKCKMSRGEISIATYLNNEKIKYVYGKTFSTCSNITKLFFDFYIPVYNICIEFDGDHHFIPCFDHEKKTLGYLMVSSQILEENQKRAGKLLPSPSIGSKQ